jgi:hypothetical protein
MSVVDWLGKSGGRGKGKGESDKVGRELHCDYSKRGWKVWFFFLVLFCRRIEMASPLYRVEL